MTTENQAPEGADAALLGRLDKTIAWLRDGELMNGGGLGLADLITIRAALAAQPQQVTADLCGNCAADGKCMKRQALCAANGTAPAPSPAEGDDLPPLPPATWPRNVGTPSWNFDEVREYARAAQAFKVQPKGMPSDDDIKSALFAYEGALAEEEDDSGLQTARDALLDMLKRLRNAATQGPAPARADEREALLREMAAYEPAGKHWRDPLRDWKPRARAALAQAPAPAHADRLAKALEHCMSRATGLDPFTVQEGKDALSAHRAQAPAVKPETAMQITEAMDEMDSCIRVSRAYLAAGEKCAEINPEDVKRWRQALSRAWQSLSHPPAGDAAP